MNRSLCFLMCILLISTALEGKSRHRHVKGNHGFQCTASTVPMVENNVPTISRDARDDIFSFLTTFMPKNPTILECGGFDGTDTLSFANFWPDATIYTFEAVPELYSLLKKRTASLPNIFCYGLALSDTNEEKTFYLSYSRGTRSTGGSSSLLPPKDHLIFDHNISFPEKITVQGITLDDWAASENVDHIDLMWLDMQGFELNMLKASELVKKTRLIYMEVIFVEAYEGQYLYPEIKQWMESHGFELVAVDFNEFIALQGASVIHPKSCLPYFGNAVFLNKAL